MNVTCPSCQMENAYFEIVDSKGAHYCCPDCDYEWIDTSVTADDDDDDVFKQAAYYATSAFADFFNELIADPQMYKLNDKDTSTLKILHRLLASPGDLGVKGFFSVLAKEDIGNGSSIFQEIVIDEDGLRITNGGYEINENGGDSYSNCIFPTEDEMEALNIESEIDEFINDFKFKMQSGAEVEIENNGKVISI